MLTAFPPEILRYVEQLVERFDLRRDVHLHQRMTERGTVGEFDGLVKYRRLVRPGQDPSEVVIAEKLREDDLRGERLGVVRWVWDEIDPFTAVAMRLRRSFGLSTSRTRRGIDDRACPRGRRALCLRRACCYAPGGGTRAPGRAREAASGRRSTSCAGPSSCQLTLGTIVG